MKELTLKELQSEELKILKDVHEFCVLNNIRYSLYGGTLIGALRHKGFIPWDDDIDIIMPRPDYTRFCKEYLSEKYKLACLDNTPNYMLAFARVYDDKKTKCVSKVPWLPGEAGVWIDVFPADGLSDDKKEIKRVYNKAYSLRKGLNIARGAYAKYSSYDTLIGKLKLFLKKVITLNGRTAKYYVRRLDTLIKKDAFCTSPMWASLSCIIRINDRKHHIADTFQSCELVDFEDIKTYIMNGADTMLRERYGDYMQLPLESDRIPKQSYIHFYWR